MTTAILAAEFTNGTKRRPAKLDITSIANGRRTYLETLTVSGKREARAIAAERGAQPWNF
jgi:hypothetical protein